MCKIQRVRIAFIMLTIMLIIGSMPAHTLATATADTWDGTIDTSWYNTSDKEFTISTAEELAGLAQITNGTDPIISKDDFQNKIISLDNNIDLADLAWTPIGIRTYSPVNVSAPFLGTLDGKNYIISNLSVSSLNDYVGLIGYAGDSSYPSATVKNLGLINCNISGINGVGGFIGYGDSSIITNSYVIDGSITGTTWAGGLIGYGEGARVTTSYSSATVSSTSNTSGGLIAYGENASITNSYATGFVSAATNNAGGLIGRGLSSTVTNSYFSGTVTGSSNTGGLIGENFYSNITNSYGNNEHVTTGSGSNGSEFVADVSGANLEEMKTINFKNVLNGGDEALLEPFSIDENFNGGYPYISTIPQIMSEDGQIIRQGEPLTIKATIPYTKEGTATKVEGIKVPIESVSYQPGSTIATLSSEYTASLMPGTYTIEIANIDYGTARGTFTVIAGTPAPVPKTSDNTNIYGLMAIAFISILGILSIRKKSVSPRSHDCV